MPTWRNSVRRMTLITGLITGIAVTRLRGRRDTCHTIWSDMKIWTTTAIGILIPVMGTSGIRMSPPVGPLTGRATGLGLTRGVGPGSITNLGAMLRFIMAAGCRFKAVGVGCRGPSTFGRFMHQPWSSLWVEEELAWASDSVAMWDGSH